MQITLNQIKEKKPCEDGWERLLKGLNKTKADNEKFDVKFILKNNGMLSFLWVLDEVLNKKKELRLFAYWNALQYYKYVPKDEKKEYKKVLNTINLYAYNKIDAVAFDATWYAVFDAGKGVWDATRVIARNFVKDDYMKK